MRKTIVLTCVAALAAEAGAVLAPRLERPSRLDTEISTNVPCAFGVDGIRDWRLSVELVATPSNNVEVAVGEDADGDGILSLAERSLVLAWDSGSWIGRGKGGSFGPAVTPPDTNGVSSAFVEVPVRRGSSDPAWLYDGSWNLMRVTARGVDSPLERVRLKVRAWGTSVMVW